MIEFCTLRPVSNEVGRVHTIVGRFFATDWTTADVLGDLLGFTVDGPFICEIPAPQFDEFCAQTIAQRDREWVEADP